MKNKHHKENPNLSAQNNQKSKVKSFNNPSSQLNYRKANRINFPVTTAEDMQTRKIKQLDVILISGDAYVDHPSFGIAIVARFLENLGLTVGVIAQPDINNPQDFQKLGVPALFFGVSAGNLDSLVANYSSSKTRRKNDSYSPGDIAGKRPDRAVIVYCNILRRIFGKVPIIIGGIEASLRRFTHYDYWQDKLRRSILVDSNADLLIYGNAESQLQQLVTRLKNGENIRNIKDINGTSVVLKKDEFKQLFPDEEIVTLTDAEKLKSRNSASVPLDKGDKAEGTGGFKSKGDKAEGAGGKIYLNKQILIVPSNEELLTDKKLFARTCSAIHKEQDPFTGRRIIQQVGSGLEVLQNPPPLPLDQETLDKIYSLPYQHRPHPDYDALGGVPAFETVRFSITSHRGCVGGCSFCSIFAHQGKIIQSRSQQSILDEVKIIVKDPMFKGHITDVGGPTANMFALDCPNFKTGACTTKSCLTPEICGNLRQDVQKMLNLYEAIKKIPGVKRISLQSGIRHDLALADDSGKYIEALASYLTSGQLRLAPEHTEDSVLKYMNKPKYAVLQAFKEKFNKLSEQKNKKQFVLEYFITGHPGCTLQDMLELALKLKSENFIPDQVQDFLPSPFTKATCAYYTGLNPETLEQIHIPKGREKSLQRALIHFHKPENRTKVLEALKILHKEHLLKYLLEHDNKKGKDNQKHSS